jgi:crossover junction endodeoxyribonuclease RusA
MDEIRFTLPIPQRELSPNGRAHFSVKSRHVKEARLLAHVICHNAMVAAKLSKQTCWKKAVVTALVIRKDRRGRWDDDNFKASCKAYMDGVADSGLLENDRGLRWGIVESIVDKSKGPCVEFTVCHEV